MSDIPCTRVLTIEGLRRRGEGHFADRIEALESSHAELLEAVKWVVEECDLGPMAFRKLTRAIERAEEVK